MSSGKCRPFCPEGDELTPIYGLHTADTPTFAWWRHQMETFSASLAICVGNSPVTGEFPKQGPVTRSFDVFFDLRLNKRLSKQSWGWWFETPPRLLWRHSNGNNNCIKWWQSWHHDNSRISGDHVTHIMQYIQYKQTDCFIVLVLF